MPCGNKVCDNGNCLTCGNGCAYAITVGGFLLRQTKKKLFRLKSSSFLHSYPCERLLSAFLRIKLSLAIL